MPLPGRRRPNIVGQSLRHLYRRIREGYHAQGGAITQSRPAADPALQAGLSQQSFANLTKVVQGQITDCTAIANCYRLQLEKGMGVITGTLGTFGSTTNFGATSVATLIPGTRVSVLVHPGAYYGIITGTIPDAELSGKKSMCDQISHASRQRVDDVYLHPLKLPGGGGVTNWMNGRPFDATNVGEQGWITETGMRIFIDPFMAMLGCDEATGIFAFFHDQLLRIAAYNLRMFSAGMEREGMDDQGEYNDWVGFTPYPWEQMGMFERSDPRRELTPQAWQIDEPHYGPWEPKADNQRPWHRDREFHGYAGQGGKRNVCTYPASKPPAAIYDPTQPVYPGLFDATTLLDGSHLISSAKRISISKRAAIVAPARKYVPEQIKSEGDSETTYKAAGVVGAGPDHQIKDELATQGSPPELSRALGVQDLHAYMFNYAVFHGVYWHEKDWATPEESEMDHVGGKFLEVPTFSQLGTSMFLDAPTAQEIEIDHRYQTAKFYQNTCGIDLLEDGGVVIYDGFGGEIRMTAGGVTISAPGDVMLKPGRTAAIFGGDDIVLRAKNSMDLTTTEKDIRLKAEGNLHVLAGNGGSGGLLLESRGTAEYDFEEVTGEDVTSGGIVMRAPTSEIVGWAPQIYLRTGGGLASGAIAGGPIILDADRGKNQIITHSSHIQHYLDGTMFYHFGTEGEVRATDSFNESLTLLATGLFADGVGIFNGNCIIDGSFLAANGHIVTTGGCSNPEVGCLDDPSDVTGLIAVAKALTDTELPETAETNYQALLQGLYYDTGKAGNDTVITSASFSLRSVEQYGTEDFKLFEDRWQQQGRLNSDSLKPWVEKHVSCRADGETFPYPGKANFKSDTYYTQDLEFVELPQGRDKDRGAQPSLQAPYTEPKYGMPTPASLQTYPVIR